MNNTVECSTYLLVVHYRPCDISNEKNEVNLPGIVLKWKPNEAFNLKCVYDDNSRMIIGRINSNYTGG